MQAAKNNPTRLNEFIKKYNFLQSLPNVHLNFAAMTQAQKHPLEQVYIHNIFAALKDWAHFEDYQFYIIGSNANWNYEFDKKSIVLYLSNEDHQIPEVLNNALAVFTPYCPTGKVCPNNCFPIPLGYNGSLSNLSVRAIEERKIDVFFSGNLHKRRLPFFAGMKTHLWKNKFSRRKQANYHIQFNNSFGGGMSPEEYSQILMNSKIALVPEGYRSNVSFRFFEAAKYGTIIITKGLYDYWFFKEFPCIQVESWMEVGKQIRYLLDHPELVSEMHLKLLNYYQHNCSEEVVANYIIEQVANLS